MKIIFSRKGFDSSIGKIPSPIFEDGSICSFPIPTEQVGPTYSEIKFDGIPLQLFLDDLLSGKGIDNYAHLDPDLDYKAMERKDGWRPSLGQSGVAEGHLVNESISEGDIFIFFGLFKEVIQNNGSYTYKLKARDKHIFFGWMQFDKIINLARNNRKGVPDWASEHPHVNRFTTLSNDKLYISTDKLSINENIPGACIFPSYESKGVLTDLSQDKVSIWKLPEWIYPENKHSILSYHKNMDRWSRMDNYTQLKNVARGQEFVLNCDDYPEALGWFLDLF